MKITLTIPAADVDALSAAWAGRHPLKTDAKDKVIETTTGHLTRTYQAELTGELVAARIVVATAAVKNATTDEELKDAMLVEHRLRHPA